MFDIRSLTWDGCYPQRLLLWGLSDPRIAESCFEGEKSESLDVVWACLGVNQLDMLSTLYRMSEGKHSQQLTMPYNPTLTSSSVHNSSHQRTALFLSYYIAMLPKWPLVRKSDVKQEFTTTITTTTTCPEKNHLDQIQNGRLTPFFTLICVVPGKRWQITFNEGYNPKNSTCII